MQMDQGLDTGAMLFKQSLAISEEDTSASLYQKLAEIGPKALLETLSKLSELQPQIQDEKFASYAKKLSKEEAKIDWALDAKQLEKGILVTTGDGCLLLTKLQLPGKKPMSAADVLNGRADWFTIGTSLT